MDPLVIAHRGASGYAPENSLKAFELAAKMGADGIELDIYLTRDKHIVVVHDNPYKNCDIRKSDLSTIKKIDIGDGEKIPTLDEVFESVGKKFKIINVEIKTTGYFTDGIEKFLIALIKKHHLEEKVIVSSFNPLHLMRMKKLAPHIKRGHLVWHEHWVSKKRSWISFTKPDTINIDHAWLNLERLKKYRKFKKAIWVWTVNSEEDMKKWLAVPEVTGIITNYPDKLIKILNGTPLSHLGRGSG